VFVVVVVVYFVIDSVWKLLDTPSYFSWLFRTERQQHQSRVSGKAYYCTNPALQIKALIL